LADDIRGQGEDVEYMASDRWWTGQRRRGGFTYFSPRDTSQWWPAQIVLWISFLSAATWHANIPSPLPLSLLCCHSFSFDVRAKANTYHCTNKRLLWSWMEFFRPIQIQTI